MIETYSELVEMVEIILADMYEDHPMTFDEAVGGGDIEWIIGDIAKDSGDSVERLMTLYREG